MDVPRKPRFCWRSGRGKTTLSPQCAAVVTGVRSAASIWGGRWDSNPRRPESQSGALPTELRPPSPNPRDPQISPSTVLPRAMARPAGNTPRPSMAGAPSGPTCRSFENCSLQFSSNLLRRLLVPPRALGAPGRTRTCDPRLRRPMLYPAELRAQSANHISILTRLAVHPCTANRPDHPRSGVRAVRRHVKCPREGIRAHPRLRRPVLYPAELRAHKFQATAPRHRRPGWSGQRDSNPRPSAPKADALPDCAMPRQSTPAPRLARARESYGRD